MSVRHLPDQKRFTIEVPGGEGVLTYDDSRRGVLDLQHTLVPEAAQGQGIGGSLVEAAMRHARSAGLRVLPTCPFVKHWLEQHPDDADLVAR